MASAFLHNKLLAAHRMKRKNLLDTLRQPTYHDSEAIVFAFANLQIKR